MLCIACGHTTDAIPCERCGEEPRLDGRWQLLDVLGQGANGTTYRAQDEGGHTVAAKESTLQASDPGKLRELVEREARVLRQLAHDGVPAYVEEIWHAHGRARSLFLLQEYVEGIDLQARLDAHRYDEAEVVELLDELAGILGYLHGRSPPIVHRDVKPSNVMRRPDGRHVLLDFGSVRDVLKDAQLGGSTVAGTFGYMAPEQFAGDASPRSDLYALGALAVALLTRQDPAKLSGHDRQVDWRGHTAVSAPFAALIDELLASDPDARPANAAALQARLRTLDEPPVPKTPPSPKPVRAPSPHAEPERPRLKVAEPHENPQPEAFHQPPVLHQTASPHHRGDAVVAGTMSAVVLGLVALVAVAATVTTVLLSSSPSPPSPTPLEVARIELPPAPWPTLTEAELATIPAEPRCEITYLPDHETRVGDCPDALRPHVAAWVDLRGVDTRRHTVTTELTFVPRPNDRFLLPHESHHVYDDAGLTYPTGSPDLQKRPKPKLPQVFDDQSVARTVCEIVVDIGPGGAPDAATVAGCPAPFHDAAIDAVDTARWATQQPVRTTFELVFRPQLTGKTTTYFKD